MRAGSLAAVTLVAAVLGGGAALGIGKGAGWIGQRARTVVVKAQTAALRYKARDGREYELFSIVRPTSAGSPNATLAGATDQSGWGSA